MSADLFQSLHLSLTPEEFRRLPRHPAYRYEWSNGQAFLTPRPRFQHALLDLETFAPLAADEMPATLTLRPVRTEDWEQLPALFAAAFGSVPPFGGLEEQALLNAARNCLEQTRTGGDGPLLPAACFTVVDREQPRACGALLATLIPNVDLSDSECSPRWELPPPGDALERRLGRPHLTWVFVHPSQSGRGLASSLLSQTVLALLALGFHDLATTFLAGNEHSVFWHWRNGFRLLGHPTSWRELQRRWK